MKEILAHLVAGQTLSEQQALSAFEQIMSGHAEPAQIGAFAALLTFRKLTVDELTGAARAMRRHVVSVAAPQGAIDTCGAGGTGSRIFNVSTTAAIVAAACGVPVAKHANRAITSRSGSADVLQALGVGVRADPAFQQRCLREAGLCFCYAPQHHPAMARVAQIRQSLGFATIFNLMGPLTNPAGVCRQVAGVPRTNLVEQFLHVLMRLGTVRAMIVCGNDPQDGHLCELTISGPTRIGEFSGHTARVYKFTPEDAGLKESSLESCRVNSAEESAVLIRSVLTGRTGPPRDMTLLNSAAALWAGGRVDSLRAGIPLAAEAIDSGKASGVLEKLIAISGEKSSGG